MPGRQTWPSGRGILPFHPTGQGEGFQATSGPTEGQQAVPQLYRPLLGGRPGCQDKPRGGGRLKTWSNGAFTAEPSKSRSGRDEPNGVFGRREPLAYHPKMGR